MTILHTHLPFTPWGSAATDRLPGIGPAQEADAFQPDEAYGGQMALRDRLIRDNRPAVIACLPSAEDAARELWDVATGHARAHPGFVEDGAMIRRPDGSAFVPDPSEPMASLGRLFQEDYCILQKPPGAQEHVLTAAVLCFPAHWRLDQKIGRPLIRIHRPVAPYDPGIAARVQRLFDTLLPGRALWRGNIHRHPRPDLFTPQDEDDPAKDRPASGPYLRSERQVLFALPKTGAAVFAIHTFMIEEGSLTAAQRESLPARLR